MPTARRDHVVVTGAAGFIGSHLAEALVDRGHRVVGVDALRDHYPPADKWSNLSGLLGRPGFELHRLDLATAEVEPLLAGAAAVFHLAARPGVRTSFGPGFSGYLHDMGFRRFIEAAMAGRPLVVYGDGDRPASSPTSTTWSGRPCWR
jgi:nucleoside-diphosphate-sugar epimerase